MKTKKILSIVSAFLLLMVFPGLATPIYQAIAAPVVSFTATLLPQQDSAFDIGTSTRAYRVGYFDQLCLTSDACKTAWPAGGGGSSDFPFTPTSWGVSTSTTVGFVNGLMSMASSTFIGRTLFAGALHASSTALFTNGFTTYGSSTLQGFTAPSGSITSLTIPGLTTKLLGTDSNGLVGAASFNGLSGASQTLATTSTSGGWGFSSAVTTHTLNIPTQDGTQVLGLLSGANWTTFNNKQATVSVTSPVTLNGATIGWSGLATSSAGVIGNIPYFTSSSGLGNVATSTLTATSPLTGSFTHVGTTGSLGCQTASGSQAGCLSSTDWSTFNSKNGWGWLFPSDATTTPLTFGGGLVAGGASSTFSGVNRFTGAFHASTTALFTNGFTAYASSTLQNFTANAATFSGAVIANSTLAVPINASLPALSSGQIGIDTTTGQFKYHDGTNTHVVLDEYQFGTLLASTTIATTGKGATTTLALSNPRYAATTTSIYCKTNTGTYTLQVGHLTSSTTPIACSSSGTALDPYSGPNGSFSARESVYVGVGSQTGSADWVTITITQSKVAD